MKPSLKKLIMRFFLFYTLDMSAAIAGFKYGWGLEVKSLWYAILFMVITRFILHLAHVAVASQDGNDVEALRLIRELTEEEGSVVIINSQDAEAMDINRSCSVEISNEYTGWIERRFYGRSIVAALYVAVDYVEHNKRN